MSRIAVFGAGYVGLVTGACLAELGHNVVVRDVLADRIEQLRRGEVPIFEPGLDELLERNRERLRYTTDVAEAVAGADFLYVAVGTPPTYSGDADLSAVWTVVDELPADTTATIVMKSTVPVGTGEKVRSALDLRGLVGVGYVSNPEFTAEGTAVRDFTHPDRVVVGAFDPADAAAVAELHDGIDAPVVVTDVNSAEMVKLAANAFLMTRISFINEIANVCEAVGADVVEVARGVGLDRRLGPHFLRAGIGYGGSCLAGEETVLVRLVGRTWLTSLERLFQEVGELHAGLEALSWDPNTGTAAFLPVSTITKRRFRGELVELRTKMGRRVRATPDHPFVVGDGSIKLAGELTNVDWLPVAQSRATEPERAPLRLDLLAGLAAAELEPRQVIVRAAESRLAAVGARALQPAVAGHPRRPVARSHDIVRSGALRLDECEPAGLEVSGSAFGTTRNGTYVPDSIVADERFWRVAGLYAAGGHCSADGRRRRICWSFHPRDELDLVEEIIRFWRLLGVKATVDFRTTSTTVTVSSRILADWWLGTLGLGATRYEQRVPDQLWSEPEASRRAFLSGIWRRDGSWSSVGRGPHVVLEYGTVSRRLADGLLRLLGDVGVMARLEVGRTAKSTCDTYWLVVSGADQVERLLDLVAAEGRPETAALPARTRRIAPTGYRRDGKTAWVRVVETARTPFDGFVYSLEVPGAHTFVTTGGLVTHNCFPKDSLALKQLASNSGYHFQLLSAVIEVNELQKRRVIGKLVKHLGKLRGKRVALLGLAFKPGTDDMREAPSLVLSSRLLAEGAEVRAWDPVADAAELLPTIEHCDSWQEAVRDADAAVIVTEWPELRALATTETRDAMRNPLIIDGRNLLDPLEARSAGFAYEGIGRRSSPFDALAETPERERVER